MKRDKITISKEFLSANKRNRDAEETPIIATKNTDPFNLPATAARESARKTRPCKTYAFIDEPTKEKLVMIKAVNKLDSQDFIFAAIKEFMNRYVGEDNRISEEGREVIKKLLQ